MKKTVFLFLFIIISITAATAQEEDAWVYFKDKPSSATFLGNPLTMLTQRALDRRTNQSIALDIKDVPLESTYVASVAASTGITVKARSKWLNALHIRGTKVNIDALVSLTSIDSIHYADRTLNKGNSKNKKRSRKFEEVTNTAVLNYGQTANQINMLQGEFLHNLGYTGNTKHIAIIDAGFKGVESFAAFANLRDGNSANGEILGGYDFVNRSTDFYANTGSTHGLSVLSTIGGHIDSQFIGTAPDAQFYLFTSEDNSSETPLEESLWVEAVERADSLGVDIINTSLGYTTFDDASYNYSYADMDGKTTFISKGAEIGSSRGMILVTSAGNSGNDSWKYISAPADAVSTLSVGAVNASETIASFSSFGPTSDNRVKPEVLAQGQNAYVINVFGNIATSNGTSFSSPIMAGMVACLWEAYPSKTAAEIKNLIVQSSDQYNNPTDQRGYGVPDFKSIIDSLSIQNTIVDNLKIIPNPVETSFQLYKEHTAVDGKVIVRDVTGKNVFETSINSISKSIDISNLKTGVYFLELTLNSVKKNLKLIKK